MLAITLGDVALVKNDAAGLTLGHPPSATLGDLLLLRMVRGFLRTLVCRCFLVAVAGTVLCVDSTKSANALTVRSASEMHGAEQCAGYNSPTTLVKL